VSDTIFTFRRHRIPYGPSPGGMLSGVGPDRPRLAHLGLGRLTFRERLAEEWTGWRAAVRGPAVLGRSWVRPSVLFRLPREEDSGAPKPTATATVVSGRPRGCGCPGGESNCDWPHRDAILRLRRRHVSWAAYRESDTVVVRTTAGGGRRSGMAGTRCWFAVAGFVAVGSPATFRMRCSGFRAVASRNSKGLCLAGANEGGAPWCRLPPARRRHRATGAVMWAAPETMRQNTNRPAAPCRRQARPSRPPRRPRKKRAGTAGPVRCVAH